MNKKETKRKLGSRVIFPQTPFNPSDLRLDEDVLRNPEKIDFHSFSSPCGRGNKPQDVESYIATLEVSIQFIKDHQRPVGQTSRLGKRLCSGTLIDIDLFLSASHCLEQGVPTQVTFGFQRVDGRIQDGQSFRIIGDAVENGAGNPDYAIFRLENTPGSIYGVTGVSRTNAAKDDIVCIIGHPATAPKQIAFGHVLEINGSEIHYNDVDTLGGDSGAGILHRETGLIVGVHTSEGCAGTIPESGSNVGVNIESLLKVSPTLRRLAR